MTSSCILRSNWACRSFVLHKLQVAMNGVVFKLSAKRSNNANDRLTMLGLASDIRLTFVHVYDYTFRVFLDLLTVLPMHPVIHETHLGAKARFLQFTKELAQEAVVARHVEAEAESQTLHCLLQRLRWSLRKKCGKSWGSPCLRRAASIF